MPPTARRALALLLALPLAAACAGGADDDGDAPVELVVSAASSLTDVVRELSEAYAAERPGVTVRTNVGASGALEQQIRRGAEVDLFVSAAVRPMDALARDGLVDAGTRREIASNELVLVVPAGAGEGVTGFEALAGPAVERVALGTPASVPAGEYAVAALERLGLWARVEPKAVFTTTVRQALAYVERGEVDAALVYRTDALATDRVRVVAAAPPGSHPPIAYPAAVVAASRRRAEAERFLDFLAGERAAELLRRRGFGAPGGAGPER